MMVYRTIVNSNTQNATKSSAIVEGGIPIFNTIVLNDKTIGVPKGTSILLTKDACDKFSEDLFISASLLNYDGSVKTLARIYYDIRSTAGVSIEGLSDAIFEDSSDIASDPVVGDIVTTLALSGVLPAQSKDGKTYFNLDGSISTAEVLDILDKLLLTSGTTLHRPNYVPSKKTSIDGVSSDSDYFVSGYNSALVGELSSPFYNLYSRYELTLPITTSELAYIFIVCAEVLGKVITPEKIGVSFEWGKVKKPLRVFKDIKDYKMSTRYVELIGTDIIGDNAVLDVNIKNYKLGNSMFDYMSKLKDGKAPIPFPMVASIVEMINAGFIEDREYINPLHSVSRHTMASIIKNMGGL